MLSIEIQCEAVLFLHLRNPLEIPGQGTFHGQLIVQVEEEVTVGTIRIVWDVSVRRVDGPRERSQHVTDVPLDSESLTPGRHVIVFTIALPGDLPATRDTPYDKVTHVLSASALSPTPDYDGESTATSVTDEPDDGSSHSLAHVLDFGAREVCVVKTYGDRAQLARLSMQKIMEVVDLGRIENNLHSDCLVLGSGFFVCLILSNLDPRLTICSLSVFLEQTITHPTEDEVSIDRYTLYQKGPTWWFEDTTKPPDGFLWRGPTARLVDSYRRKKNKRLTEIKEPVLPYTLSATESALHLQVQPRLPSPVIGGVASSPALHAESLSTITHQLIFRIKYSVLGDTKSKSRDNLPPEGPTRQIQWEHPVDIAPCTIVPDSTVVPVYVRSPEAVKNLPLYDVQVEREEPTSFTTPRACTSGTAARQMIKKVDNSDLKEKQAAHRDQNSGQCACFHEDKTLSGIMGTFNDQDAADARGAEEYTRRSSLRPDQEQPKYEYEPSTGG